MIGYESTSRKIIGYEFTSNSTKFKVNLYILFGSINLLKNFRCDGIFIVEISSGLYFSVPQGHLIDETNKIRHATICFSSLERNLVQ
jgi:hypothetical protein